MNHRRLKNNIGRGGFTLVEILIAIFILSLVMATVYVSYTGTLKTSRQLEEEGDIYKMARTVLERMTRDLSSLQMSEGAYTLIAEKNKTGNRQFHAVYFWSASHLAFSETESEGRPAAVGYFVREDDGGQSYALWRSDVPGIKPDEIKQQEKGFIICKNIEAFGLTFYDAAGEENDTWDTSLSGGIHQDKAPAAVRIELVLINPNDREKPYKFMTKVFLPASR